LAPGPHTIVATYSGNPGFSTSSSTLTINVVTAPTVVAVQRTGFHAQPTRLVLSFSSPLDPARAQDVSNYMIVGPLGQGIGVDEALYDPSDQTVTLSPHRSLNLHSHYLLTVNGTPPEA